MLLSAVASACLGAVTARLRADYLAIATFGIAVVIELVARNATRLTGGSFGFPLIPRPFESWADRPLLLGLALLGLLVAVTLAVYVVTERMIRGPWGRVLRAIREDERAVASLGKSPQGYRLQAFALGGGLMGLAGALEAHVLGFIAPENFGSTLTFQIWAMVIVGGAGNSLGVLLGAFAVSAIWSLSGLATDALLPPEFQARGGALRIIAIGGLLALMIVVRPKGLLGERVGVSRFLSGPKTDSRSP
jgi:branched-chain amino acid transport system permease protein